jgi:hypothetical protein
LRVSHGADAARQEDFEVLGRLVRSAVRRPRISAGVGTVLLLLGLPTGASAAQTQSNWPYVVSSVSGSASWAYQNTAGSGVDAVTFSASRRATRAGGVLAGVARYSDANPTGCGRTTRQATLGYGGGVTFLVHDENGTPYVRITWNRPFPQAFRCKHIAALADAAAQLEHVGAFSTDVPLSRFACPAVTFAFGGHSAVAVRGTAGTFKFKVNLVLTRV